MSLRSKIQGCFLAGCVGDAWGFPVEMWPPERIEATYPGGVHKYHDPIGHKWFKPDTHPAGTTTDDAQYTIATLEGLIAGKEQAEQLGSYEPYMDAIAKAHVESLKKYDAGAGTSIREAIQRLSAGTHWKDSGKATEEKRGAGNGISMKVSALAIWAATPVGRMHGRSFNQFLVDYAAMTHATKIAAQSGVIHAHNVLYCLQTSPENFSPRRILENGTDYCWWSEQAVGEIVSPFIYDITNLADGPDHLITNMSLLANTDLKSLRVQDIRQLFGGGGGYVFHSLPYAYAFFLRNPHSLRCMDEVINAGGDTDTNAKMVGDLLGALHGIELLQQPENAWTLEGLRGELLALINHFCDVFGVE